MLRRTSTGFWVRNRNPRIAFSSSDRARGRGSASLAERLVQPRQHHLFALVRLALGRRPVTPGRTEALEPSLGDRQVGHRELQVEPFEVAPRIDRTVPMRDGRIVECADHVEESLRIAEPREVLGRQLLSPDPALGRGRRCREVDVGHVRMDDLLGPEDLGQAVETNVRHLDDPDVELEPPEPARLRVTARQRVEDGRLARCGKADDGDLHIPASLAMTPAQYPAAGSTTFTSGSPPA
jgi:hypothetical protein